MRSALVEVAPRSFGRRNVTRIICASLHCPTRDCNSSSGDWHSSQQLKQSAETEFSFLFENEEADEIPVPITYRHGR
jgi:hypothetical protein